MKLEDIIFITENWKGTETNYLFSVKDYLEIITDAYKDSPQDMARAVEELYQTKERKDGTLERGWLELYVSSNKSFYARFCGNEAELNGFLLGYGNHDDKVIPLDETKCSPECLEVLKAYGIGTDGHSLFNSLHYEAVEHDFHAGEIVRNLNESDYRILEKLSPNNLLLMSVNTGEILVGVNTQYYQRTPKGGYTSHDSVICGIEWGQGIYLGNRITNIDFEGIRSSYGVPKEKETLAQYRDRLKHEFRLYESLKDNMNVTHEMREAAWKSMNAVFATEDYDTFLAFLNKGFYDGNFRGILEETQQKKQEKSR